MKLFSKNREALLSGTGVKKYIAYAIGEIILVVIGILIAVSINSWNEERSNRKYLKNILGIYQQDLITDTTRVGATVRILEEKQKLFKIFLGDSVTKATYVANPQGYGLIIGYAPVEFQKKGIQLLENYTDDNEMKTDSLVNWILTTHHAYNHLLNETQGRISADIDDNLYYFKNNQPWIADMFKGKFTDEINAYFLSKEYQARLSIHSVLANQNLLPVLKAYQSNADTLLVQLKERLQ